MNNPLFLLLFSTYIYAYTGSFILPKIGACDNFVMLCNGNAYMAWTNSGYAGGCASNDGMILVAENAVSVSCPGASYGVVCRGPGSNCYGTGSDHDYYYTDCPQACTYTTSDSEPPEPPRYCASIPANADALLAQAQAECEAQGGAYSGDVVPQANGDYCVEGNCSFHSNCPSENPAPPALRKSISERIYESVPEENSSYDYSQQCKPKPFYDALGRKTAPRPEIRRRLFAPKKGRAAMRGIEPGMEGLLRREEPVGQCCVESFGMNLVNANADISVHDKFGVNVGFNAQFYGEEYESGCNPSCCEFKQEAKGFVKINNEDITRTSCRIDGQPVRLDSIIYKQDCYGRDCEHFDDREGYDDSSGIYEGTDYPGLNNVVEGDAIDIRMEFNSYIKDRCNAHEIKGTIPWGFHIQGIVPDTDGLEIILLGEIGP